MRTIEERRFEKGLELWRQGAVTPNGVVGQYYVASRSGNGRPVPGHRTGYLVATAWAECYRRCTCEDYKSRKPLACKHIAAAELAEAERRIEQKIANGGSLERIRTELMWMACEGVPGVRLAKWEALWAVSCEMAGEPIP